MERTDQRILCATDLRPGSEPTVAVAANLARLLQARLELLHVIDLPPEAPDDLLGSASVPGFPGALEKRLGERGAELAAQGVDVITTIGDGRAEQVIRERAAETGAQLVVLGIHKPRGAARSFAASVAERVTRTATCPVLVVPSGSKPRLATWTPGEPPLEITAGVNASGATDAMLKWLAAFAPRIPSTFRFVHLYWPPREHAQMGFDPPDPFEPDPEVVAALTRDLNGKISAAFETLHPVLRVRPTWGDEDEALVWEASTDSADLLAVGTSQGRHSTAFATIRASSIPVLCVPARLAGGTEDRVPTPIEEVLVTTDFSPHGNTAIKEAYRLLLDRGGTITLMHVNDPLVAPLTDERRETIERSLLGLRPEGLKNEGLKDDGLNDHGIRTRTFVADGSVPAEAIVKAARRLGADIVVMASHGRSGLGRALSGSVTEAVARHLSRPLLVVPADPEASHRA